MDPLAEWWSLLPQPVQCLSVDLSCTLVFVKHFTNSPLQFTVMLCNVWVTLVNLIQYCLEEQILVSLARILWTAFCTYYAFFRQTGDVKVFDTM